MDKRAFQNPPRLKSMTSKVLMFILSLEFYKWSTWNTTEHRGFELKA